MKSEIIKRLREGQSEEAIAKSYSRNIKVIKLLKSMYLRPKKKLDFESMDKVENLVLNREAIIAELNNNIKG